jgi:hypothetical protein
MKPGSTILNPNPSGSRWNDIPRKKFSSVSSGGKIVITVFWDEKGVIFMNFLPRRTTVNSDQYIETLRSLNDNLH